MLSFSVATHAVPSYKLQNSLIASRKRRCCAAPFCNSGHLSPASRLNNHVRRDPASRSKAQSQHQFHITAMGARQTIESAKPKTASEIKTILTKDFRTHQYLVTGNLTEEIYTKFCRVSDPTGVIWGIQLYKLILSSLFDPQRSSIKLKNISVTGPSSIEAVWSKEGFLQLPWNPYLTTQEGKTLYTINKEGLICDHKQIWLNMTALQGIKLALTPSKQPR